MSLTPRFDDALMWAAALHRHQDRKGSGIPYVAHLLAVAALVLEDGGDEDTAIAALLHDSIEDCGVTEAEIAARCGPAVARLVAACTDSDEAVKRPWRARKERAIRQLQAIDDTRALRVAAADKVHNITSLLADLAAEGSAVWDRFTGTPHETVWYYEQMHATITARLRDSRLPIQLAVAVAALRDQVGS